MSIGVDAKAGRGKPLPGNRWVVKFGSSLVTADGAGLDRTNLPGWVQQLAELHQGGKELVLVSSGAVAEGMARLGMQSRPQEINLLQAAAAVGQMGLIRAFETCFAEHGLHTAQILLTHDDTRSRERYLNARTTLQSLLRLGVIPVVNENDTVVTDEIRMGDNDTLAALVANLLEADLLLLLTDQPGLCEKDPRLVPEAPLVQEAAAGDRRLDSMVGRGSELGRGGMLTKLSAARRAARSGAVTVIASGQEPDVIRRLAEGEHLGTRLIPDREVLGARKQWLAALPSAGRVFLDAGAAKGVHDLGRSLLAIGVTRVEGRFSRGDMVACVDESGRELARGLVNYSSEETRQIKGKASKHLPDILGYKGEEELIHRDNLVVL